MSRIGKLPVRIPQGVKAEVAGNQVKIEGPKGKLEQEFLPEIEVKIQEGIIQVTRRDDSKRAKSLHGLTQRLISNMVLGVSKGFSKTLLINGVGYRAEIQGKSLVLSLGYSLPLEYPIPAGMEIKVEGNNRILVSGFDKQKLGQICAEIRSFRPPEPYKGKGIRYENETVRRKVGKTGVK